MKKTLILSALLLGLLIVNNAFAVTVDGNAYLENQSNHNGIKILFERIVPSSLIDSTFTDSSGYYSKEIEVGIYDITYSKDYFHTYYLYDQILYSNITFSDITLTESPCILNVPSVSYPTIQSAIEEAYTGDTVLVDTGRYYENINFIGKNIAVGSLFLTIGDTTYISQTVIDGNNNGHVVEFSSEEDSSAILTGFTIINGNATNGGGIYCRNNSSPILRDVIVYNNFSSNNGGGIYISQHCWPHLNNVNINGNHANGNGGGIYGPLFLNRLNNVIVNGNSANGSGGGIYNDLSNMSIWGGGFSNVIINGNTAGVNGGGIYFDIYQLLSGFCLSNITISGNSANNSGGGIYFDQISGFVHENFNLTNCTISNNVVNNCGGGIFSYDNSTLNIVNSIVSNNTGSYGIFVVTGDPPSISFSDFWNNEEGNLNIFIQWLFVNVTTNANGDSCDAYYNIQMDPLFVDPSNEDYHLTANSPCIDAGDQSSPLDPDGTVADMGAFYFEQTMSVYPTELDFGDVLIGSDSTLSVTLNNYSDSLITIYNVLCSDTIFTNNWTEPNLPSDDSLVIDVTFTPNTTGSKTGTLTIENSYFDKTVSLSGNGLGAYITSDVYSLNFGAVEPGYPDTLSFEITNQGGNIDLEISLIDHSLSSCFYFVSITDSTISPDNSSTIQVEFNPQVEGLFNDTLFIVSNAYNEDTLKISLSGEGGLTPAPVENLTIYVDSVDAVLNWSPVTTTIHGNPLVVDAYLVYCCGSPDSVFYFHGYTIDTTYTHNGVSFFNKQMFYQLTAYVGDMPKLLDFIAQYPNFKIGELELLVERNRIIIK